jgi:hypothetical protein
VMSSIAARSATPPTLDGADRKSIRRLVVERRLGRPQPATDLLEHLHREGGLRSEQGLEAPRGDRQGADRSLGYNRGRARSSVEDRYLTEERARS